MISSALLKCRNRNVKRVSRKIVASLTSQWWGWWWWWWGWKWWWWWRWHVKYDSCWYPTVVNISPPHMQMFTEAIKICNEPLQKFCSNTTVRSSSSSPSSPSPSSSSSSRPPPWWNDHLSKVGEEVCRTHYQTSCETRYVFIFQHCRWKEHDEILKLMIRLKEHEVVQDEPVCRMVKERKCRDIQGLIDNDRQWSTMINRVIDDNCIGLCLSWNIKWKFFPFSISPGWGWRRWWPGSSLHWTRVWRLACPEGNAWSFLFIVISILDDHYCSYTYNQRLSSRKLWCICSK